MAAMPLASTGRFGGSRPSEQQTCPHCRSSDIFRQRARGIIERHVVRAFHFFPFRSATCYKRFYLHSDEGQVL
jgi:hypothetical protein